MDRRFLSHTQVVEASRSFVCIRLATYESASEAAVLKTIFIGRSGELENTTFALLTPEGEVSGRAGRSPNRIDRDGAALAARMRALAARYETKAGDQAEPDPLPLAPDLRLGLNLASCDARPLVVIAGANDKHQREALRALTELAATEEFVGRFEYAVAGDSPTLATIQGAGRVESGVLVVSASTYGDGGSILAQVEAGASSDGLAKTLRGALGRFQVKTKLPQRHIPAGRRSGVHWKTKIPVTDPGPRGRRR